MEERAKLFSAAAEREEQKEKFCKGHVKGLAARILNKSRGVHTIDNVWLGEGQARYLPCEVEAVKKETERFFHEWMRSKAEEWGMQRSGLGWSFQRGQNTMIELNA